MPGIHYKECFPAILEMQEDVDPHDGHARTLVLETGWGHLDKCEFKSLYRDGVMRYFFASVRCECWCHRGYIDPLDAAELDLKWKWFCILLFGGPPAFFVLAIIMGWGM